MQLTFYQRSASLCQCGVCLGTTEQGGKENYHSQILCPKEEITNIRNKTL